ncbi:MAG: hypothetical protein KC503_19405 [Myxococcales bacterium]|nr:hypothetical protein [Myxococcales bacterium]
MEHVAHLPSAPIDLADRLRRVGAVVRAALTRTFTFTDEAEKTGDAVMYFAALCHLTSSELLKAQTLDDVYGRLDTLIEDPRLFSLLELSIEALEQERIPAVDRAKSLESLDEFGTRLAEFVSSGALQPFLRGMQVFFVAVTALPPVTSDEDAMEALRRLRREGLFFLVDDSVCPREKLAAVHALKFVAVALSLIGVFLLRLKAEPWLQLALAQAAEASAFEWARWVASKPDVELSEEIVSASARYDWTDTEAAVEASKAWVRDIRAKKQDAEASIYPLDAWKD